MNPWENNGNTIITQICAAGKTDLAMEDPVKQSFSLTICGI